MLKTLILVMKTFLLIPFILSFSILSHADYETYTLKTFEEVVDFTTLEAQEHGEDLLVVFDIDRTLLETLDCIDKDRKFKNGFLKFEAKVRECYAEATSPLVPELINELKAQKIDVMALTARGSSILKGTLNQLENRLLISKNSDELSSLTFETAPLYSNRKFTVKFQQPGKNGALNKKLVIKRGVATATGADKGLGLQALLKRAAEKDFNYSRIVFVDDDKRNIKNLEKAFANTDNFISILHYIEHRK